MKEDLRMELKKVEWELEEIDKSLKAIQDDMTNTKVPQAVFALFFIFALFLGLAFAWWSLLNPEGAVGRGPMAAVMTIAIITFFAVTYMDKVGREADKLQKRLDIIHARLDRLAKEVEDDD